MKVASVNNSLSFNAIKVRKLKPLFQTNEVIFYNNATAMLEQPKPLFEGATCMLDAIARNLSERIEMFLDTFDLTRLLNLLKYLPKKEFQNRMLYGIIGSGLYNTALQLDNNDVLCISGNMEVFETREFEDFDLPIKSRGNYPDTNTDGWYIRQFGLPINKTELARLAKRIMSKGYKLDDWRREQACKVDGKIYLLDYECAVKPNS